MKTDLTRSTFRREKHYSSVRMQQGRVQLDADWNEQLDIDLHAETTTRVDVIGACGSPEGAPGFTVGVTPDGSDLTLSPGRIYVDGVLCELETTAIPVVGASGKNLRLAAIMADDHQLAAGDWVSLTSDGAASPTIAQLASVDAAKESVTFASGGPAQAALKSLAAATNPTLTWVCTYLTQPDFPGERPSAIELAAGGYLAYLDVWQQNVIALDDGHIRETALGGPDTATRTRTVWQLLFFPAQSAAGGNETATCQSVPANFPTPSTGLLRARAEPETAATDPCTIPPGAGFRRLENQLYRVEIHDPGEPGKATFKWSRENGSVAVRWLGDQGSSVLVDSLGRDEVLGFAPGNLIELGSELDEVAGAPGVLATVNGVDEGGAEGPSLALAAAPPAFPTDALHPKARRWEGQQDVASGWLTLEDGVEIEFADGFYNTGDYWLIPARTATGDVEWPTDGGDPTASPPVPPTPLPRPPEGIAHGYCKLAALGFAKTWTVNAICRPTFPPLTALPTGGTQDDPGIHVIDVRTTAGTPLRNDSPVHASELARGLVITCDRDVEQGTVKGKPTVFVTLDLPYPLIPVEYEFWKAAGHIAGPFGTTPVTLDCSTNADGATIEWLPTPPARSVVANVLKTLVNAPWSRNQLLVHLTLKGNFVYAAGDPNTNVDGEAFGLLKGATLDAQIPQSGDGRRGGNLDLWFWLVPDAPLNGIVVGVLATPAGAVAAAGTGAVGQVLSLVIDRAKLAALAGASFSVDTTVQPNLDQARQVADSAGMAQQQLRIALDDRLAGAGDMFTQELAQIGVEATFVPLPAATIGSQPSTLLGQGLVAVITTPDVIAQANQTTAGVLPPTEQVTL